MLLLLVFDGFGAILELCGCMGGIEPLGSNGGIQQRLQ
jgi:hypothetical protein